MRCASPLVAACFVLCDVLSCQVNCINLIGADNRTLPLYHFVEVLDELVDYDSVIGELPYLSHAQVSGAISFLRKLAQVNPNNLDPDAFEDEGITGDPVFMDELRKALADKETSRVLSRDQ